MTIERARLRGVVLREPLLLRAGGGALVRAVASGLGNGRRTASAAGCSRRRPGGRRSAWPAGRCNPLS
ncbi:hypothetical protein O1L44_04150 [Streptomyces noursei]|nr:hypothetical protein [Streptomyces noursei]